MDHFSAGVGLLPIICQGDRVKLTYTVIAAQDTARIFPGNRRAGLYLSPGYLGIGMRQASFGDKVVDTALALSISRIPVLHG